VEADWISGQSMIRSALTIPATISAGAVLLVGAPVFLLAETGPVSNLMVQHLLAMNVVAPLVAVAISRWLIVRPASIPSLCWSSVAQISMLWLWHAPSLQAAASESATLHMLMLAALVSAATTFWWAVMTVGPNARWGAIAALLLTGKLACLGGGLLIFAPRDLFNLSGLAVALCTTGPSTLGDQQFAGLMMIAACPLSYVVAAIAIATQFILDLERKSVLGPPKWAVQ
jgi:putative membrane protein